MRGSLKENEKKPAHIISDMKLKCNKCGKSVSTEVPETTIVRGWIECPECIEKSEELLLDEIHMLQSHNNEEF